MKLAEISLLEVVSIVRDGLINGDDISEKLRNIDLEADRDGRLTLTKPYLEASGRVIPSKVIG